MFKITLDNQSATEIGRKEIYERYNIGIYKESSLETEMTPDENPIEIPQRKSKSNRDTRKNIQNNL